MSVRDTGQRSILGLLGGGQATQDSGDEYDPDSPSAMLLRELQDGAEEDVDPSTYYDGPEYRNGVAEATEDEVGSDNEPPTSIMYEPMSHPAASTTLPMVHPQSSSDSYRSAEASTSSQRVPVDLTASTSSSGTERTASTSPPRSRQLRPPSTRIAPAVPSPSAGRLARSAMRANPSMARQPEHRRVTISPEAGPRRRVPAPAQQSTREHPKVGLDDYEKALWKWVNVTDLDGFLQEVYAYYVGKGIWCIVLARVLNLLTTFFVIAFSTFLLSCIDYSLIPSSGTGRLEDVIVDRCLTKPSFAHLLFTIIFSAFYIFQLASFAFSVPRLLDLYRFYTHLLGVPDADIQTMPWPEIVNLIGGIRKHNPITSLAGDDDALSPLAAMGLSAGSTTAKLDAHDVANRILRQENYLIALFNKDLLDLRVRIPISQQAQRFVPSALIAPLPSTTQSLPVATTNTVNAAHPQRYLSFGANTLTKALEWNLRFCLLGYLFDRRGLVRKEFIRERRRADLVDGLKRRFIFMGILNVIFAPFIIIYLLMYSFFRYFEEYHKNPSSIGGRQYTPYAQWKFREFNELPHLFKRRLDRSYPVAKTYIDQFPKERTALIMRFVAFVAGSFAAVLLVASLVDPDLFLHFEITKHRTVLFYLGVFGTVLAVARGMIPEDRLVFDPEHSLREVVQHTHYLPTEWKGKLHSQMVHQQFGQLFEMKVTLFLTELASVLLTPLILWFSLPPCASAIVDFFREFTVHVEGVGYVCSFAVFDFKRHGNVKFGAPDGRLPSNEGKMEKSFLHFKATHPDWEPTDPASSVFLSRLADLDMASSMHPNIRPGERRSVGKSAMSQASKPRLETMRETEPEWDASGGLGTAPENGDVSTDSSERDPDDDRREDDEDEEGPEGFLRDAGVMGLLQQVLHR